jgi:hypothetical protein
LFLPCADAVDVPGGDLHVGRGENDEQGGAGSRKGAVRLLFSTSWGRTSLRCP